MSIYRTTLGELRASSLAFEIATFIIGASIFGYTCLRAYSLSFTHDESVTYLNFVCSSIEDILTFDGLSPSNNHLLNSLLMKASASLFGPKEFFLRLPNLIAHIFYLYATFLVACRLNSPLIGLGGFIILNSNPFLLDFFSIARGYGLALCFLMLSMYYFLLNLEEIAERSRHAYLSSFSALLATLSNFTFLGAFFSITAVLFASNIAKMRWAWQNSKPLRVKTCSARGIVLQIAVVYTAAALTVLPLVAKLYTMGELYFGGNSGFWSNTLTSLVKISLYDHLYLYENKIVALNVSILTIVLSAMLLFIYQARTPRYDHLACRGKALVAVVLTSALITVLQKHMLGIPYLEERTAVFFIPIFYLVGISFLDSLSAFSSITPKLASLLLLLVFTSWSAFHAIRSANLTHTLPRRYDSETKQMVNDLAHLRVAAGANKPRIRLGASWVFEPTINFYRVARNPAWLGTVTRDDLDRDCDFYYYQASDKPLMSGRPIAIIKEYPIAGNVLARAIDGSGPHN